MTAPSFLTFSGTFQGGIMLTAGEKERCRWDKENEESNFSVGDVRCRDAVNKTNCQSSEILIFHLDRRGRLPLALQGDEALRAGLHRAEMIISH